MAVRSLLILLAMLAATSAAANRLVLYEGSDFRGRHASVLNTTPNLAYLGFENRASSVVVNDGVWELCTEPYFNGNCRTYRPGEYRNLGEQADRVSSARLVAIGSAGGRRPAESLGRPPEDWRPSGDPEVQVFDRQDFSGPLRSLRAATPNFEPLGFNDAIASIIVVRGTWQFCTDADYRGDCVTYGPGRYARLPDKDDRFSSAQPIRGGWGGGGDGGWGSGGGDWQGPARIRLFEGASFSGREIWLERDAPDFSRLGFNDRATSVIVEGGVWRLCSDARGEGRCREYRPGQYPYLPPELKSRVSSAFRR